MWKVIKKVVNFISRGVKNIMDKVFDESKEIVEAVMENSDSRNKTGEIIMGLGVGIAVLGFCVSDHRPHKITWREMNKIRYFVNRCGWIFVAASWILPHYTLQTNNIDNKEVLD